MLKVTFKYLDKDEVVAYPDADFDDAPDCNEWLNDDRVNALIKSIDDSKVLNVNGRNFIESSMLGVILPKEMSTGVKCLILALKDDEEDRFFKSSSMGDNCFPYLFDISRTKDIKLMINSYFRIFPEEFWGNFDWDTFEVYNIDNGKTYKGRHEFDMMVIDYLVF